LIIYTGIDDYFSWSGEQWEELEIRVGESARLVVRPHGFNRATVLRLITSDPQDYLRREYQPGTEINLSITNNHFTPFED